MNELINQLADKAKNSIPKGSLGVQEWIESYNEKFAELIVKEVLEFQETLVIQGYNAWHLRQPTQEHFGIEE